MEYSTLQGKLIMPEYGRNIQHMVEHACTIEDEAERERCVRGIIRAMQNLFPYLKTDEGRHTIYDHLAVMSDFRLQIDYPYGEPHVDELAYHPDHLGYNTDAPVRLRHYGKLVEDMIAKAIEESDEQKQHFLINRIANRMKYTYLTFNKDQVDPERIKSDLELLSGGRLSCDFEGFHLLHGWQLLGSESKRKPWFKKKK